MGNDDDPGLADRTIAVRARPAPAAPALRIGHFLAYTLEGVLRRVGIGPEGLTIGRVPACDVAIPLPEISRRHCRIEVDGNWAVVSDLGSTNGTFLGGRRVDRRMRLRNGSQISLGGFELRYEHRDEREVEHEARLTEELRRAVEYVRAILPEPMTAGPVQADWWFVPSSALGGDAFGYQFLDETTLVGFVLDVSGHGIGSAMHAANVANVLRRRGLPGVDFSDPSQVAAGLNAMFPMEAHNDLMLTLWYFAYHTASRRMRFCSAGHHASLLVAQGGAEPAALWRRAPAIGMLPTANWASGEADIPQGARVYVFSDGAFEIATATGAPWGIEDLRRIVAGPEQQGISEAQRVYQGVRAAARPGPLDDDLSVLVLRFE
jgi:serine phosphatase RsbU (regulator of sigma subunit)